MISSWEILGGKAGIYIHDTISHFAVRGCAVSGGKNGILLVNCRNGSIEGCEISGTDRTLGPYEDVHGVFGDGVCILNSENVIVQSCLVVDAAAGGIAVYGSSNCAIRSNDVIGSSAEGIGIVRGSSNNIVSGNTLSGNGGGYYFSLFICSECLGNSVFDNVFDENDRLQLLDDSPA